LAVEAEPYTFLRNQEEFEQSLRGGDDALLDHVEARHEEVSEALAQ
jgi:hypothetical protein